MLPVLGVLFFVVLPGCSPYRPPPATPPLIEARGAVRVVREPSAPARVHVVLRAGSAYDPPSREGLAYVVATAVASASGAALSVGPELVQLSVAPEGVSALAAALAAPLTAEAFAAGKADAAARFGVNECAAVASALGDAWILAGHPYGHAVFGRSSVIPTLSLAEGESFRLQRYARDAAVIAVDGEVNVTSLLGLFTPSLSSSVTPAVRSKVAMEDLVVVAPVTASCSVVGPRRPEAWSAADQAAASVAAELVGAPPPPARVDPFVTLTLPGAEAALSPLLEGDFEAARERVRARVSVPSALPAAADILLVPIRMGHAIRASDLASAVNALTDEAFDAWVLTTFGEGAVRVAVFPDTATASTVESTATRHVLTSEALFR
ncbi:hypothetical protein LBMAG42_12800 [Deltaproteobacteria bacterium]|nr:hypothetical protein LBMAG42_12800 [Deltaproteobacteria bacterium]